MPSVNSLSIMVNATTKMAPPVYWVEGTYPICQIAEKNVVKILSVLHSPTKERINIAITAIDFKEDRTYLEPVHIRGVIY